MAPLPLRHSPKLHDFTAFKRRYRVESRPSSKARKNRKFVYKSMSSKKESKTCHVRRPSQRSLQVQKEICSPPRRTLHLKASRRSSAVDIKEMNSALKSVMHVQSCYSAHRISRFLTFLLSSLSWTFKLPVGMRV